MPALPAQPDLPAIEHEMLARWHRDADVRGVAAADRGRAAVDVLRGAADGERHAGRAPHRGPGLQGPVPPVQDHAGVPRRPQGRLGLPRAARRGRRGEGTRPFRQEGHRGLRRRRVQRRGAASRCCGTWTRSPRSPRGWATGSTCPPPTAPWTPTTCESVWWALKTIYDKGLLVRDFRISPYCPRCGTPLSDHEMGQPDVYRDVTDPSVTVRFTRDPRCPRAPTRACPAPTCWSGRRRRGRSCPTPRSPSTPTSST